VAALAQNAPMPARVLEEAEAVSAAGVVVSIASLRAVSAGAVFINDRASRRVVLLDEQLRVSRVIADTSAATGRLYGPFATGLFAARGDSTLFLNGATMSMHVIDAHGRVVRVMAPPRPSDFGRLIGGQAGNPGFDVSGNLVYRAAGVPPDELARSGAPRRAAVPESVAVLRFDFENRRVDTAAFMRIYTQRVILVTQKTGDDERAGMRTWQVPVLNPMPTVDDWAVLSDGRIAIVRGQDYHVDFIDGSKRLVSGPNVPFAWRHLSDADKLAVIDSSKALRRRLLAEGAPLGSDVAPTPGTVPVGAQPVSVSTRRVTTGVPNAGKEPETAVNPSQTGNARATGRAPDSKPDDQFVEPHELPDYQPVFAAGGVRADADGHVWVRTIPTNSPVAGAIYDVIDGQGQLIDRVQVPHGSVVAGFAPGGVVFLAQRERQGLVVKRVRHHLPKAR
jgi:hypothetical protein